MGVSDVIDHHRDYDISLPTSQHLRFEGSISGYHLHGDPIFWGLGPQRAMSPQIPSSYYQYTITFPFYRLRILFDVTFFLPSLGLLGESVLDIPSG